MRGEPSTFSSRSELLACLQEAIPSVDERAFAAADTATQILFARDLELSDEQLKVLGTGVTSVAQALAQQRKPAGWSDL